MLFVLSVGVIGLRCILSHNLVLNSNQILLTLKSHIKSETTYPKVNELSLGLQHVFSWYSLGIDKDSLLDHILDRLF